MKELGEDAVAPEEQQPGFRSDEGGQNEGQSAQSFQNAGMGQPVAGGEKRERHADDHAEYCGQPAEKDAVPEAAPVKTGSEDAEVVIPGEAAGVGGDQAGLKNGIHGVDHQQHEHDNRQQKHRIPDGKESTCSVHARTVTGLSGAKHSSTGSPGANISARFREGMSTRRIRPRAST